MADEYEILKRCSSLVRRLADGDKLELAHFTVKEFLIQIDDVRCKSISTYRVDHDIDNINLARICLTYTVCEDVDQVGRASLQDIERRLHDHPFRFDASYGWYDCMWRYEDSDLRPANVEIYVRLTLSFFHKFKNYLAPLTEIHSSRGCTTRSPASMRWKIRPSWKPSPMGLPKQNLYVLLPWKASPTFALGSHRAAAISIAVVHLVHRFIVLS